jgi:hypothetical protein
MVPRDEEHHTSGRTNSVVVDEEVSMDTVHELYDCEKNGDHLCEDCSVWLMEQDMDWAEERSRYA